MNHVNGIIFVCYITLQSGVSIEDIDYESLYFRVEL